ncbi:MAG: hypothetical protein IIZ36_03460 [Ruminococcus sp.]|nr:hypothetical protein [Ruminococcus sp.]
MDCKIVFYSARKTAYCEKILKRFFSVSGLCLRGTSFSTDAVGLGERLCAAFEDCAAVFVVGGLDFGDKRNTAEIISRAVNADKVDYYGRIKNKSGPDGYLLRAGESYLILLPDEPRHIEEMTEQIGFLIDN